MRKFFILFTVVCVSLSVLLISGCSSSKSTNNLAPFEPEIVNTAGSFQFQATDVENVTTIISYDWQNSNSQATIDHSSVVSDGTVSVAIFDADSTQVYTSGLLASANEQTTAGTAGTWRIVVTLDHAYGTFNFRVEPL